VDKLHHSGFGDKGVPLKKRKCGTVASGGGGTGGGVGAGAGAARGRKGGAKVARLSAGGAKSCAQGGGGGRGAKGSKEKGLKAMNEGEGEGWKTVGGIKPKVKGRAWQILLATSQDAIQLVKRVECV
jgi:hypothetical protein